MGTSRNMIIQKGNDHYQLLFLNEFILSRNMIIQKGNDHYQLFIFLFISCFFVLLVKARVREEYNVKYKIMIA